MANLSVLSLNKFRCLLGDRTIENIFDNASTLSEKSAVHINSTYQGGGVAEILNSLIILMNDVGIKTDWRVMHGSHDFFSVTKKFHNAIQGERIHLTELKKKIYYITNVNNAIFTHLNHDFVIVHDPQPLPIITCYKKRQPWIWRCHIDISEPMKELWDYLKMFIVKYDAMVVSMNKFRERNLPNHIIPQFIIRPSINPLNIKNDVISESTISRYMQKMGVVTDKPIISQVSRFDKWKDPKGMVKIFRLVRKKLDCQLVLMGSMAADDPEGQEIFRQVERAVGEDKDIHLIMNAPDIAVNALQRSSTVVIQRSLKEGFAITVSEALWKSKPVVASNVGGIPSQVLDNKNGYLLDPMDLQGFADRIIHLIKHPELSKKMGEFGKEHVRNNFLITRHLIDYLNLLKKVD
ncbi:MAG: glycosyltransferase [Candidatus Thermoplasmatota archaeon]|nr:glycosyltransferase [Candidatus Thermoplasmatota archaeon]